MAKWWGRNNINKVSEFLENWNCTPSLAPGVNKKLLRPISKAWFILKITNQVKNNYMLQIMVSMALSSPPIKS